MKYLNGKWYRLIFLDTNAIHEICCNYKGSGKAFIEKFIVSEQCIPCFSVHNIMELQRKEEVYSKFKSVFTAIPFWLIYPYTNILESEYLAFQKGEIMEVDNKIAYAFSFLNKDLSLENFLLRLFSGIDFSFPEILQDIKEVAKRWNARRENNKGVLTNDPKDQNSPMKLSDYFLIEDHILRITMEHMGIYGKSINKIDISKLPGLRLMNSLQYHRVNLTKKSISTNDVMDIQICCVLPYMDVVITEAYQADVLRKVKKNIHELANLEILTLRDIRS